MHAVPDQHDTALNPQVVAPGTVGVDWYPQLAAATPAMASRPQPASATVTAALAVRRGRLIPRGRATRSPVLLTPSTCIPSIAHPGARFACSAMLRTTSVPGSALTPVPHRR